ncbi:ATP-grasp domain-containing protein [Streptomyces sp. NPDC057623]|uniref:ATP-grasp domain-containing protein n=1 Tax=Streptomyces sp. NPDC057623 TaxID=3346187 RepID=UPI0036BB80B6
MTSPVLLLVESNTTGTGRQFARRAADLGAEPVLLTADASRYPYAAEDRLRVVTTDTSDEDAVLAAARSVGERSRIAGVTSSSEYYAATAAATAHRLGLPGPDADAVRTCRDKSEQRRMLAEAGVPVPEFTRVRDAREAVGAAERIGYPVVLKPVLGSGSLGVRLCTDPATTKAHATELTAASVNERGLPVSRGVLVERYLPGAEYSVEVFGNTVVVVVAKHLGPLPDFVEHGHDLPAEPTSDARAQLEDVAVRAVKALGLGWGAAHVELRRHGDDTRVIEVNPRLAGGMIPDLVSRALGVDLVRAQVSAAMGLGHDGEQRGPARAAAIRFLTAERPGVLAGPDTWAAALAAARSTARVEAAELYRAAGEQVAPAHDFRGRLGHVIAVADTVPDAAEAASAGLVELGAALRGTDKGTE